MIERLPFLIPNSSSEWRDWFEERGPNVLGILVGLFLVRLIFHSVISRFLHRAVAQAGAVRREDPALVRRRADTLLSTLDWTFTIFLLLIGMALLLDQFDVQVSAIIAGVSVVGIAVGLGAQTLIRDVINGLFILVEGQYAVGDTVTVGGVSGEVVEINPRRTVLRDSEGNIHSIPNSAITVATNKTAGLNRIAFEIEVPFREADRAAQMVELVGKELLLERSSEYAAAPRVLDVRAFGDADVRVKVVADAKNGSRWQAEAELRRRLKRKCDTEKLEMRFPGE